MESIPKQSYFAWRCRYAPLTQSVVWISALIISRWLNDSSRCCQVDDTSEITTIVSTWTHIKYICTIGNWSKVIESSLYILAILTRLRSVEHGICPFATRYVMLCYDDNDVITSCQPKRHNNDHASLENVIFKTVGGIRRHTTFSLHSSCVETC